MGDEYEALAVVDSTWGASDSVCGICAEHRRQRLPVAFTLLFRPALKPEAAVMLGFSALGDGEVRPGGLLGC